MGRFVELLNILTRDYFGDRSWVDFHYGRGEWGGCFNVWLWEKIVEFYKGPMFGVEMRVW